MKKKVGSFCAGALELWRGVGFCGAFGRGGGVGFVLRQSIGGVVWRALAVIGGDARRARESEFRRCSRL